MGPWIAGVIAVAIAFFAGSNHLPVSNIWFAIIVGVIYLVLTQVKSIWLRPQVMGRFMRMNTGVVFLAIIAAVMLQGILAALVILPLLASVGVLGKYARAKLLNLDPWPVPESTTVVPLAEAEAEEGAEETDSKGWRSA